MHKPTSLIPIKVVISHHVTLEFEFEFEWGFYAERQTRTNNNLVEKNTALVSKCGIVG